jgi:hypothetical protein
MLVAVVATEITGIYTPGRWGKFPEGYRQAPQAGARRRSTALASGYGVNPSFRRSVWIRGSPRKTVSSG